MNLVRLEEDGFQCFPGLVPRGEVPAILREVDRLRALAQSARDLDPRLRVLWHGTEAGGRTLRGLQEAHLISPVMDRLRLHPAIGALLYRVLGPDIRTVLTSVFWKAPGEAETGVAYHQDAGFRQPPSSYRKLAQSYLQLAVALDPQDEENGGLRFVPGSHRKARIFLRPQRSVLTGQADHRELEAMGFAPEDAQAVQLGPGDVVIWNAYTLHGSGPNRSNTRDRRSFTIASMRAADCDVGADAYVGGEPVAAVA